MVEGSGGASSLRFFAGTILTGSLPRDRRLRVGDEAESGGPAQGGEQRLSRGGSLTFGMRSVDARGTRLDLVKILAGDR